MYFFMVFLQLFKRNFNFFKKDILELKYKLYIFFVLLMLNKKGFKVKK